MTWDKKLGFPTVRVAIDPYSWGCGWHGKEGELLLYISCRRKSRVFVWRFLNMSTGELYSLETCGWNPFDYLKRCSRPIEGK